MNTKELVSLILKSLECHKAKHITNLNVKSIASFADVIIIATGTSKRHIQHLADQLVQEAKAEKHSPIRVEAGPPYGWVLVDLGDVIVHLMQQECRDLYQLEKLWDQEIKKPDDSHT